MKLKEFIFNLNEMVKANPKLLELEVITSDDDEGNGIISQALDFMIKKKKILFLFLVMMKMKLMNQEQIQFV